MRGIVRAFSKAKVEVVLGHLQRVCQPDIRQWPTSIADLHVPGTILQPDTNVSFWLSQHFFRIILSPVGIRRIFLPLNAGEAADPGNYAAELVGHLPRGVERADSSRRQPRDRPAVRVLADIVFSRDVGKN